MVKTSQAPRELVERYGARFRIIRTKCTTVIIEINGVRLVWDGLLWLLKKHFLRIRFTNLYHLLSKVAKNERARVTPISSKTQTYKGIYYKEVTNFFIKKKLKGKEENIVKILD